MQGMYPSSEANLSLIGDMICSNYDRAPVLFSLIHCFVFISELSSAEIRIQTFGDWTRQTNCTGFNEICFSKST